jgi:hypothetical protein
MRLRSKDRTSAFPSASVTIFQLGPLELQDRTSFQLEVARTARSQRRGLTAKHCNDVAGCDVRQHRNERDRNIDNCERDLRRSLKSLEIVRLKL